MILKLFRPSSRDRSIRDLYGAIVAQARLPAFYNGYGVPDTVQGRFDLIVLHLVLVLAQIGQRAGPNEGAAAAVGQKLFDEFCRDLDDNLREMGVGDLAVPKKMRSFAEAFYGRQAAYLAALGATDPQALENALARNIFEVDTVEARIIRLAEYTRAAAAQLEDADVDAFASAPVFPDPAKFANIGR